MSQRFGPDAELDDDPAGTSTPEPRTVATDDVLEGAPAAATGGSTDPGDPTDGADQTAGAGQTHGADENDSAPGWFELGVALAATAMAAAGLIGVALGLVGVFRTWIVLPLALVVTACGAVGLRSAFGPLRAARAPTIAAALALALAAVVSIGAAAFPSQPTVVVRDPGSYVNTALWLSEEGTLEVDADEDAFGSILDLRRSSAAVYELDDGRLQFQFNHLTSALLAVGYDLGGHRLVFRMSAMALGLGLLGVYTVTVRVTRRPFLSLTVPALLAVAAPILFVGRDTYSEPFTLALLWAAILLAATLHRRPHPGIGAVVGLLVGALIATRVDALLYIGLAAPLVRGLDRLPGRARGALGPPPCLGSGAARWTRRWLDRVDRPGNALR